MKNIFYYFFLLFFFSTVLFANELDEELIDKKFNQIIKINQDKVVGVKDWLTKLWSLNAGDATVVLYIREGKTYETTVILGSRPC